MTTYKTFNFKSLAPDTTTTIPTATVDTSTLSVDQLDSHIWPTPYLASRSKVEIAARLAQIINTILNANVEKDLLFGMIERTKKGGEHGQYCLPIPQLKLVGNPAELATKLSNAFNQDYRDISITSSTSGPFINFHIDHTVILKDSLSEALSYDSTFGFVNLGHHKRIGIDYSHPNIAKPFHAGHLRSTIIGNFVKMVYAANGFDVIGINYLGDWGKQYGLLAVGFEKYGDEQKLREDPIKHLFDVYVRVNKEKEQDEAVDDQARAYFKSMEEGDEKALGLWQRFRDLSIEKYKQVYARLNVEFELYSGESLYQEHMPKTVKLLEEAELTQCTQGALIIDLGPSLGKALIMKKDGATLYMTRDIAAAQHRFSDMKLDKSIYVVAMQQDLHLAQLFRIIELMAEKDLVPAHWPKLMQHSNFGMVKGMSTRKGNVVFLEDILDEARDVMHGVMQSNPEKYAEVENPLVVSDILAVSAIIVQDLAAKRIKDYDFKLERVTQFEGDTGPYLQYAHARLCSIERKSGQIFDSSYHIEQLKEKEAVDLAWHIALLPDTIQQARITHEPCTLVSYLMTLSQLVSQCLQKMWVKGQDKDVALARLALYKAAKIALGNGMRLIGLRPLERM